MAGHIARIRRRQRSGFATVTGLALAALGLSSATAVPPGGSFSNVIPWPIIGIHTTLLPDGRVLSFGTDQLGNQGGTWVYDIWNPALGTALEASHRIIPNTSQNGDIFCSVATVLPGTSDVLLVGGDILQDGAPINVGNHGVRTFSAATNSMTDLTQPLQYARWYATATTLPNGEVLVQGGSQPDIDTPEVFNPTTRTWRTLSDIAGPAATSVYESGRSYPRSWVAPNGKIFGMTGGQMFWLDPAGKGHVHSIGYLDDHYDYASAVMYQPGKILVVGGLPNGHAVTLIDINGEPIATPGQSMRFSRPKYANATVLPDGKVLVVGGSADIWDTTTQALPAEMWDPATGEWTTVDTLTYPRTYHSSALLLPDGRVLVVGGGAPGPRDSLDGEIFSPAYLDANNLARRPRVDLAPRDLVHGKRFEVAMASSAPVGRVTLIRIGSSTHGYDVDQRFTDLTFTQKGRRLSVRAPETLADAPPGYYMLFVLDNTDVPSIGSIVSLS